MPKKKTKIEFVCFPERYKILAADFSLNRPGFSIITIENCKVIHVETFNIDNKSHPDPNKEIGEKLKQIYDWLDQHITTDVRYFVRERAIKSYGQTYGAAATQAVLEVVGIADYVLWNKRKQTWFEMWPVSVKKMITGNGKADKKTVQKCLSDYVGIRKYKCDDESDAVAVGISWLIQQNQLKQLHEDKE